MNNDNISQKDSLKIKAMQLRLQKVREGFVDEKMREEYVKSMQQSNNSLANYELSFDKGEGIVIVGDQPCQLPRNKNEHYLCREMWTHKVNEAVDWSIIYEKITGTEPPIGKERIGKKMIADTVRRINKRIKDSASVKDELFSWDDKSVIRNF